MVTRFVSLKTGRGVELGHAQPGDWALLKGRQDSDGWRYECNGNWRDSRAQLEEVGWSSAFAKSLINGNEDFLFLVITSCTRSFYRGFDRFGAVEITSNVLRGWEASGGSVMTVHVLMDVAPIIPEFGVEMKNGVEIVNRELVPLLLLTAESGGKRLSSSACLKVRHPASHEYPGCQLITAFHTILGAPELGQTNVLLLSGRYANGQNVFALLRYPGKGDGDTSITFSSSPFKVQVALERT